MLNRSLPFLLFLVLVMTGCSTAHQAESRSYEKIEVKVKTEPKEIKLQEQTNILFTVTGDGKPVEQADVKVNIRQEGQTKSEELKARPAQKGVYSIQKVFAEPAFYHFTIYVKTGLNMQVVTQEIDLRSSHAATSAPKTEEHGQEHQTGHVMIHLMKDEHIKANQNTTLIAHVMDKQGPLTGAQVQFEYYQKKEDKHIYAEARERVNGEYVAEVKLKQGNYTLICHVEKGNIHEHTETALTVK
ncbi:FixH family protein [Lihuaxuella thermophila]|uniref:YtkA-like n=1 Tax=Lihuaxuella thermophila TaxID=1173111 RepID=A0A1H8CA19_9BACL|nr:FixH family protein [Lihuaxuella thermophila]SEM91108.1 YtkA-like [Lihuaxuella thermophila]